MGTADVATDNGHVPTFVEPSLQMSYYLSDTGMQTARRVLSIVSYSCPDITYAPSLYPCTCILLHYMTGNWRQKPFLPFLFFLLTAVLCYSVCLCVCVCVCVCVPTVGKKPLEKPSAKPLTNPLAKPLTKPLANL